MGVEPTKGIPMPLNGVEVRGAHRDSSAPVLCIHYIKWKLVCKILQHEVV
jgi:hypothetical protein